MAKKVDNKRKLKSLKSSRNSALVGAAIGGILGGYGGYKGGETVSMGKQLFEVQDKVNSLLRKARMGEKLTEKEAIAIQLANSKNGHEKLLGAIYQSPRTNKARLLGGLGGGLLGSVPALISAGVSQHKINKIQKQLKKEAEEKDFSDDEEDYIVPDDDRIKDMTRFQVLRVLDKRDKQVDRDRKKYIKRKARNSGILGSVLGAGLGALTGYYGSKYGLGDDKKRTISNSILSGISGALAGYGIGSNTGKNRAEEYVKDADEFNNRKVTRKLAKHLDKIMREQGREDDLEILNDEKFRNQKNAKREYESFLKGNNVLNLGRNSVRVIK